MAGHAYRNVRCQGLSRRTGSMAGESVVSQQETFVAFLDGMDSGAVLGYSPYPGRQSWNAVSLPFWPLT